MTIPLVISTRLPGVRSAEYIFVENQEALEALEEALRKSGRLKYAVQTGENVFFDENVNPKINILGRQVVPAPPELWARMLLLLGEDAGSLAWKIDLSYYLDIKRWGGIHGDVMQIPNESSYQGIHIDPKT